MLTERKLWDIINIAVVMNYSYVRVAQLDRASGYGPEGREFESSSARQNKWTVSYFARQSPYCIGRLLSLRCRYIKKICVTSEALTGCGGIFIKIYK